jgi:hypothetical protein
MANVGFACNSTLLLTYLKRVREVARLLRRLSPDTSEPRGGARPMKSQNHHNHSTNPLARAGCTAFLALAVTLIASLVAPKEARSAEAPAEAKLKFSGEVVSRIMFVVNENFAETRDQADSRTNDDIWSVTRFRMRLGAEFQATERVRLGFRLSSGDSSYPSSSYQLPLNDLRRFPISIDRAYIFWTPTAALDLQFGIQPNPLFTPTEILWDGDVHPIGTSQVVRFGKTGLELTAGQFWMREVRYTKENDPNTQNSFLLMEQLAYTVPLSWSKMTLSFASYLFTNPHTTARSIQTGEFSGDFKTNRFDPIGKTIADPKDATKQLPVNYFSNFSLLNFGLKIDFTDIPLVVTGDVVWNLGARSNASLGTQYANTKGFAAGGMIRYGRAEKLHDLRIGAGFFHIEADSAIAAYNNDEMQQTNINSIPVELNYTICKEVSVMLDAFIAWKEDADLPTFGGFVNSQNATRIRANLRFIGRF